MRPLPSSRSTGPADTDLLAAYAAGDQSAARELTRRFTPRIFAVAQRMLHDPAEAEDVTQEAMLRLWRIAPNWQKNGAKVSTWLYRITSNLCIDRLRKRREHTTNAIPEMADDTQGVVTRLEESDRAAALSAALAALPERQRLAIVLRHMEERNNPEIAEIMETSIEAVESLLTRARRALAAELTPRRSELGLTGEPQ
ncbi:MAG: RNA polymerase sigma factor [Rhodobacteraceae bacterium]|nr:RNA polymerase sigma factor [Paracoccaceae bacterium]